MLYLFSKKKLQDKESGRTADGTKSNTEGDEYTNAPPTPKLSVTTTKQRSAFDFAKMGHQDQKLPFFMKSRILVKCRSGRKREFVYNLNFWQRTFITMDRPQTSVFGKIISTCVMFTIVLSCVIFVISASPDLRHQPHDCDAPACEDDSLLCPGRTICAPVPPSWFQYIELACIIVFTVEYAVRVATVPAVPLRLSNLLPKGWDRMHRANPNLPDPEFPPWRIILCYCSQVMNLVDLVAIVPFYIEYATDSADSIEVIRILRLVRIMRVFKIGKYNEGVQLIARTVRKSLPALSLLLFFSSLGVILFGCLIYFAEQGTFTVNEEYPSGRFLRPDVLNLDQEVSPYSSILVSMYWVVVCITTVGFGDMYPTTAGGRVIACIAMYSGVLVLALPISVMGSTFTREYEKKHAEEDSDSGNDSESGYDDSSFDSVEDDLDCGMSVRRSGSDSGMAGSARKSFSELQAPPAGKISKRKSGRSSCSGPTESARHRSQTSAAIEYVQLQRWEHQDRVIPPAPSQSLGAVAVLSSYPIAVQISLPPLESADLAGVSVAEVPSEVSERTSGIAGQPRVVHPGEPLSGAEKTLLVKRLAELSAESSALMAVLSSCMEED